MDKKNKKKNIFVVLESEENGFEIISYFTRYFPEHTFFLFFYDPVKLEFYSKENNQELLSQLFVADILINLLPKNSISYLKLGERVLQLNLNKWQNSLSTNLLFSQRINVKKILQKFKLKTAFFKKIIKEDTAKELFLNFPQPSRIFSKSNLFFTGKINNLEELDEVMSKIDYKIDSYNIEQYIEGDDWFVFIYQKNDTVRVFVYSKSDSVNLKNENEIKKQLKLIAEKSFKDFGIEKYALFHFLVDKKNEIYFSNILTDLDFFINTHSEIMNNIFKMNNFNIRNVLE